MGWVYYAIYCILVVVPFWRLLPRYGVPAYVAIVAVFPIMAVGLLWLMAFSKHGTSPGAGPRESDQ